MANIIRQSIKNLKGGVSQQPNNLRYADQATAQVNGWTSETSGLQKRPPMTFTKKLGDSEDLNLSDAYIHLINRDESERYYAIFTKTDVLVFDLEGNQYTVNGSRDYFKSKNPRDSLRMITVSDYTFISNKEVTIKDSGTYLNDNKYNPTSRAIINVRGGQYGRTLSVGINGVMADDYTLPDGSSADHTKSMDAINIAKTLKGKLEQKFPAYTFSVNGEGIILIEAPEGEEIKTVETKDGYNNQLINGIINTVQSFNKLPVTAPNDYIIKILTDPSSNSTAYFVKYDETDKCWKECPKWNIISGLDKDTMPHALRRESDGTFTLTTLDWVDRQAGDDKSNPLPSFVDGYINDIFFHRNRLGMLSGENVILSKTGEYYDYFPDSVATINDNDPIDVSVSHNRISILKYAIPFTDELLLWSDEAQFILSAQGTLTSKTIELNLMTEFDMYSETRPLGMGRGVYFTAPRSNFTSVKRYYNTQDTIAVKDAEDISAHVPEYIPNGVYAMNASGTENFLTILSKGDVSKIYVYKFFYSDGNLMIQSWSDWNFGDDLEIHACGIIGSSCYPIVSDGNSVWLGKIQFTGFTKDYPDELYRFYVDNKKTTVLKGTYDINTNKTTIDRKSLYGFTMNTLRRLYLIDTTGRFFTFDNEEDIVLFGNVVGETWIVGTELSFYYEFSQFLIKKVADDGSVSTEDGGRLQLQKGYVNYYDTGNFDVSIKNLKDESIMTMSGLTTGAYGVDDVPIATGTFRFSIRGNALDRVAVITSTSPTPISIVGAGWEGRFVQRTQGV